MKKLTYLFVIAVLTFSACQDSNSPESIVAHSIKVMGETTDYLFETTVNYQGDLISVQGGVHKPDSALFRMLVGELSVEIYQKNKNETFINENEIWKPLAQDQKQKIQFITSWILNDFAMVKKARNLKQIVLNSSDSLAFTFDLDAADLSLDPQTSPAENVVVPRVSGVMELGKFDAYIRSLALQFSFGDKGKTQAQTSSIKFFNFDKPIPLPKL